MPREVAFLSRVCGLNQQTPDSEALIHNLRSSHRETQSRATGRAGPSRPNMVGASYVNSYNTPPKTRNHAPPELNTSRLVSTHNPNIRFRKDRNGAIFNGFVRRSATLSTVSTGISLRMPASTASCTKCSLRSICFARSLPPTEPSDHAMHVLLSS
mmetsp:Transcript_54250/g.113373  ORF Transcript_54250/g.113373 Transcript_54250/m.113373 type:complete len:156 (+) Transcript_54250:1016-1483(+)